MSIFDYIGKNLKVLHKVKSVPTVKSKEGFYFVSSDDKRGAVYVVSGENVHKIIDNFDYYDKTKSDANLQAESNKLKDLIDGVSSGAIRKTYPSVAAMNADASPKDGETGLALKYGQLVSVENETDSTENAIYRWLKPGWEKVDTLGDLKDYAKQTDLVQLAGDIPAKSPGKNLFDYRARTENRYIDLNGTLKDTQNYDVTAVIDISERKENKICIGSFFSVGTKDAFHRFINSDNTVTLVPASSSVIAIPTGATKAQFSLYKLNKDISMCQIEFGDTPTSFEDYNPIEGYTHNLATSVEKNEKEIVNKIDVLPGKNLFDKNSVQNLHGLFYDLNGNIKENRFWTISHAINVSLHQGKYISSNKFVTSASDAHHLFLDENGAKIMVALSEELVQIPTNAVTARMCLNRTNGVLIDLDDAQIEYGTKKTFYEEYSPIAGYAPEVFEVPNFVRGLKGDFVDFRHDSPTRVADMYNHYDQLVNFFPNYVQKTKIGESQLPEGDFATIDSAIYDINTYIFAKSNLPNNAPKIILSAGIHGYEASGDGMQGVVSLAYLMQDICNNQTKKFYKNLRENFRIIVIPLINPWGYQNNRRCNGRGVDLNRNFDINFVANLPSYGYKSGAMAFSEAESKVFSTYIQDKASDALFMCEIHTRGGTLLTKDLRWLFVVLKERVELHSLLDKASERVKSVYGGIAETHTYENSNVHGSCFQWVDRVLNIPSYEPEFFPTTNAAPATLYTDGVQRQCVHFLYTTIEECVDFFT